MEWINGKTSYTEDILRLKETNDCTVVAWANVFDCEYTKAHAWMKRFGRIHRKGMQLSEITAALNSCTKAKIKIGPYTRTNRISVSKFCKQHDKGRYYVCVRGHAFAIKDGVVYDYYAGPKRLINFACRVYLEGEI